MAVAGGDGPVQGLRRAVHAATPDAVAQVLRKLTENDPDYSSIVLVLEPPYLDIAPQLGEAIRQCRVLTSLQLILTPDVDEDEIVGEGGPVDVAICGSSSITVLDVKGVPMPKEWRKACLRNSCLATPAPRTLKHPNPDDKDIDLTAVSWAFRADGRFDNLPRSARIAAGGMGEVYRVTINGEEVAAKTTFYLAAEDEFRLNQNPEGRQQVLKELMRELAALRQLDGHPNVVGFRSVAYIFAAGGEVMPKWICMELAEMTLDERIWKGEADFLPDMHGMMKGLEYIHSQGMMHRDMKPKNVLISMDGRIIVADLGFVKVSDLLSQLLVTANTPFGTPSYLAPDAVGSLYDRGRDIYAVGVIAIELLLRESPHHEHEERMKQADRAMTAAPEFAWLIRSCTQPLSANRPSSRGVLMALEWLQEEAVRELEKAAAAATQRQQVDDICQLERTLKEADDRHTRELSRVRAVAESARVALEQMDAAQDEQAARIKALEAQLKEAGEKHARELQDRQAESDARHDEATKQIHALERKLADAEAENQRLQSQTAQPATLSPGHACASLWGDAVSSLKDLEDRVAANHAAITKKSQSSRRWSLMRRASCFTKNPDSDEPDAEIPRLIQELRTVSALGILNFGVGPNPPCKQAVQLLQSAADQGNPNALCELGMCLYVGRGAHINTTKAKNLWKKAMDKGSVEAAGFLALDHADGASPARTADAVARWRERAELGHADAQTYLARCYADGVGVAPNAAEAVKWYRLGADQGCATAQNNLGSLYWTGTGVTKDCEKAAQLFQLAADLGDARAQSNLGWIYESGEGLLLQLQNKTEAFRLYRLSAEHGDQCGQYNLGRCYAKGIGVTTDVVKARTLLTKSARQGHSGARQLLARRQHQARAPRQLPSSASGRPPKPVHRPRPHTGSLPSSASGRPRSHTGSLRSSTSGRPPIPVHRPRPHTGSLPSSATVWPPLPPIQRPRLHGHTVHRSHQEPRYPSMHTSPSESVWHAASRVRPSSRRQANLPPLELPSWDSFGVPLADQVPTTRTHLPRDTHQHQQVRPQWLQN